MALERLGTLHALRSREPESEDGRRKTVAPTERCRDPEGHETTRPVGAIVRDGSEL